MAEKLFTEFPPVTTAEWEAVINQDLKGADYEKRLVWKTQEGFSVRPYYRSEDLKNLQYKGTGRSNNSWFIHQGVCCCDGDYAKANKEAKTLLTKGVESLAVYIDNTKVQTVKEFATLLDGISLTKVPVTFCGCSLKNRETLYNFLKYIDTLGVNKDNVRVHFDFNPIMSLTTKGYFEEDNSFELLAECIKATADYKLISVISVDGFSFNSAGATATQELAYALSIGSDYIVRMKEFGISAKDVGRKIIFSFAIGNSYFMEIAKFRAARTLWKSIVTTYKSNCQRSKKMVIHATTSDWNKTVYDSYVNMLRVTTEAMSAAIAGVDFLEVTPFDFAYRVPNDFSNRIARNVQSILKAESNFDKVTDPSAGSYYIENLSNSLGEAAWKLFASIEEEGGFIAKFCKGEIQSDIKAIALQKEKNLATRRETLLGTNQYPNFLETADPSVTKETVSKDVPTIMGMPLQAANANRERIAEPLKTFRVAQDFELLRLSTDRSGKEPKVFMLTYGNLAMCRARAQFSSNFFAVAGFRTIDNNRFASIEEGVQAALEAKADIVVACSSDEEYAEGVPQINTLLGNKALLVVAGEPLCKEDLISKGVTNFISVKSNVLETLRDYQAKLGIKTL